MDSIKENIIEGSIVDKKPTISDVARLAGVSKKNCLPGDKIVKPNVGAKTLSKVKKVIEDLDYSPNPSGKRISV